MYTKLTASYDTTIYEDVPDLNTGKDEILELGIGSKSRILIKFDQSDLESFETYLTDYSDYKFNLKLNTTEFTELPSTYQIQVFPVSQSWQPGTGHFHYEPYISNGASWNNSDSTTSWNQSGSDYLLTPAASSSYSNVSSDIEIDITNICTEWISGSLPNHGLLIKLEDETESTSEYKFFSNETHTIYYPKIEFYADDSVQIESQSIFSTSSCVSYLVTNDQSEMPVCEYTGSETLVGSSSLELTEQTSSEMTVVETEYPGSTGSIDFEIYDASGSVDTDFDGYLYTTNIEQLQIVSASVDAMLDGVYVEDQFDSRIISTSFDGKLVGQLVMSSSDFNLYGQGQDTSYELDYQGTLTTQSIWISRPENVIIYHRTGSQEFYTEKIIYAY